MVGGCCLVMVGEGGVWMIGLWKRGFGGGIGRRSFGLKVVGVFDFL